MKNWAWLSFTACGIGLLLCGCGGGSTPAVVSPLAGNWLLAGPMPTDGITFPPSSPPSTGVRLAMTFDVKGDQVSAGGFGNNFCDNVQAAFNFLGVAGGTIAKDGSFTTTSANSPFSTVSIKGTAPQKNGAPWSGSYTVSLGGNAPACDANLSGTFTATSFPLVSGVYVGNRERTSWLKWRLECSASDASSDAAAGRHSDESGERSGFELFQQRLAHGEYQGTGISLLQFGCDAIHACEWCHRQYGDCKILDG